MSRDNYVPKRAELGKDCPWGKPGTPIVTPEQWVTVVRAIAISFPMKWKGIVKSLRFHYGDRFYSFTMAGMFVGVELDGYIHT
jgi:hypothetical protein